MRTMLLPILVIAAGCGRIGFEPVPRLDAAGSFDAGSFDASGLDAGPFDASGLDAAALDAGMSDGPVSADAAGLDASSPADAGPGGPPGVVLTAADGVDSDCPAALWNGSELLVVWRDRLAPGATLRARTFALDGSPVGAEQTLTAVAATSIAPCPDVVSTASTAAVVWAEERTAWDVQLALVDRTGAPTGVPLAITADGALDTGVSAAWSGTTLGVSWVETRGINDRVQFTRVTSTGIVGTPVSLGLNGLFMEATDIVWTGAEFVVAAYWNEPSGAASRAQLASLSATGAVLADLTDVGDSGSTGDSSIGLAWTGASLALAWRGPAPGALQLGLFTPPAVPRGPARPLDDLGRAGNHPVIAADGSHALGAAYLVSARVHVARMDAMGVDTAPDLRLGDGAAASYPEVVAVPGGWAVLWAAGGGLVTSDEIRLAVVPP